MDTMNTMNAMIESILDETDLSSLIIDTEWSTQNVLPTTLGSQENTLDANYAFPPAQMAFSWSSDGSPTNTMYDAAGLFSESISPDLKYVSLDGDQQHPGYPMSHESCGSFSIDAKETAKERRRTQNRFAQRAYRQRKEQAIKDLEKEIEALKLQLEKEKKLNQAFARAIELLKERLKGNQPELTFGTASSGSEIHSSDPAFSSYSITRRDYFS